MYSGSDELEEKAELEGELEGEEERYKEGEERVDTAQLDVPAASQKPITVSHSSSEYVTCTSEMDGSQGRQGPGDHASQREGELIASSASNRTLTTEHAQSYGTPLRLSTEHDLSYGTPLSTEHVQTSPTGRNPMEMENGLTGQLQAPPTIGSGRVHVTHPFSSQSSDSHSCKRFNNLLDKCNADESDIVRPKPRVQAPSLSLHAGGVAGFQQPVPHSGTSQQARVGAASSSGTLVSNITLGRPHNLEEDKHVHIHTSLPEVSPSPDIEGEGPREVPESLQSFLFPVSNSPMDLVTTLSRLASFTGELLMVLTPKISKTNKVRHIH